MIASWIPGLLSHLLPRAGLMLQAPAGGTVEGPSILMQFLVPLGLVFAIFYFLVIRPANRKQKALQERDEALRPQR